MRAPLTYTTTQASAYVSPLQMAQLAVTPQMARTQLNQLASEISQKSTEIRNAFIGADGILSKLSSNPNSLDAFFDIRDAIASTIQQLAEYKALLENYQGYYKHFGHLTNLSPAFYQSIPSILSWIAQKITYFGDKLKQFADSLSNRNASRVELSVDNKLQWDENSEYYQATTIAHGHMLTYKTKWLANGYSLGDLLSTFALGPCQKKQIAVLEYGRHETASRVEDVNASESFQAHYARDRSVKETIDASIHEQVKGKSRAYSAGIGAGAGVSGSAAMGSSGSASATVPIKGIPISLAGKGSANASGSATGGLMASLGISGGKSEQKSSRKISSNSMNRLRERINQGASAVRNARSTVVQSVSQTESVSAVTEVITNKNLCHSVNYMFFEVLQHFVIETSVDAVDEVLFIPIEIGNFDRKKILRWWETLVHFVPDANLQAGFQAISNLEGGNPSPDQMIADEQITDFSGTLTLSFDIPMPDFVEPEVDEDGNVTTSHDYGSHFNTLFGNFPRVFGGLNNFYRLHFWNKVLKSRQTHWDEKVVPDLVFEFIESIKVYAETKSGTLDHLDLKVTQLTKIKKGVAVELKLSTKRNTQLRRSDITAIQLKSDKHVPDNSRIIIERGMLAYRSKNHEGYVFVDNQLQSGIGNHAMVRIVTPLNYHEMRNLALEEIQNANDLIEHLNANMFFYHKIIALYGIDANQRFAMLDGIKLHTAGGQSVANLVENTVVDFIGNCFVMPVAQGLRLDPMYRDVEDLLEFYKPEHNSDSFKIALPTGGYFMEAVMGSCSSCEELDYTKARFNGFGCTDEPTGIDNISMDSRRADPGDLQAKDLPANIVNFQNNPAAPDPTKMANVFDALTKADVFRDAAGLSASQANALAAMSKNADGAQAMAQISADLTKQAMAKLSDQMVDRDIARIEAQKDKGNITEDQAKEQINNALNNKNSSTQAQEQTSNNEIDNINQEAKELIHTGADDVEVRETKPDGSTRTVKAKKNKREADSGAPEAKFKYPKLIGIKRDYRNVNSFFNSNMTIDDVGFDEEKLVKQIDNIIGSRFAFRDSSGNIRSVDSGHIKEQLTGLTLKKWIEQDAEGVLKSKINLDSILDWRKDGILEDFDSDLQDDLDNLVYKDIYHTKDPAIYELTKITLIPQFDKSSAQVYRNEIMKNVQSDAREQYGFSGGIKIGGSGTFNTEEELIEAYVDAELGGGWNKQVHYRRKSEQEVEVEYSIGGRIKAILELEIWDIYTSNPFGTSKKLVIENIDPVYVRMDATIIETIEYTRVAP